MTEMDNQMTANKYQKINNNNNKKNRIKEVNLIIKLKRMKNIMRVIIHQFNS